MQTVTQGAALKARGPSPVSMNRCGQPSCSAIRRGAGAAFLAGLRSGLRGNHGGSRITSQSRLPQVWKRSCAFARRSAFSSAFFRASASICSRSALLVSGSTCGGSICFTAASPPAAVPPTGAVPAAPVAVAEAVPVAAAGAVPTVGAAVPVVVPAAAAEPGAAAGAGGGAAAAVPPPLVVAASSGFFSSFSPQPNRPMAGRVEGMDHLRTAAGFVQSGVIFRERSAKLLGTPRRIDARYTRRLVALRREITVFG